MHSWELHYSERNALILEVFIRSQSKSRIYDLPQHTCREAVHEARQALGPCHLDTDSPERI